MDNLNPAIAAAMAPFVLPRTPEQEANFISADVAEAVEKQRPDYEDRPADRIERQDRDTRGLMVWACMPGDRL